MFEFITSVLQLLIYYLGMLVGSFIIAGVTTRIIEWVVIERELVERVFGKRRTPSKRVHVWLSGVIAFLSFFIVLWGSPVFDVFSVLIYLSVAAWMAIDLIAVGKEERALSDQLGGCNEHPRARP